MPTKLAVRRTLTAGGVIALENEPHPPMLMTVMSWRTGIRCWDVESPDGKKHSCRTAERYSRKEATVNTERRALAILPTILVVVIVLLVSFAAPVSADPGTFVFPHPPKWSGGHRAMVTDPLVSTVGGAEYGYVRFPCQSKQGFEYSIGIKGLAPHSTYYLAAVSLPFAYPPGSGPVPTSDGGGRLYRLGTIRTGADGDGELDNGLVVLPATHPFLPFGLYNWEIRVRDSSGTVVLHSPADDTVELQVFP